MIDSMVSLAFVQPNGQSFGVGAWYIVSTGDMLHRNVDSLATLPTLRLSDSKMPAIGHHSKLLGLSNEIVCTCLLLKLISPSEIKRIVSRLI